MSLFQIPRLLQKIRFLDDTEKRKKALLDLACKIDVQLQDGSSVSSRKLDEIAIIELIRKKYKERITNVLALFGFFMIIISGFVVFWESF